MKVAHTHPQFPDADYKEQKVDRENTHNSFSQFKI